MSPAILCLLLYAGLLTGYVASDLWSRVKAPVAAVALLVAFATLAALPLLGSVAP